MNDPSDVASGALPACQRACATPARSLVKRTSVRKRLLLRAGAAKSVPGENWSVEPGEWGGSLRHVVADTEQNSLAVAADC